MSLAAEQLTVVRGGRRVVDEVSFTLGTGEILVVVGANGAGKTSLLEALLGFLPRAAGRVAWTGAPLRTLRRHRNSLPRHSRPAAVRWLVGHSLSTEAAMTRASILLCLALLAVSARAEPPKATTVSFNEDGIGGPPSQFEPVVGAWNVGELGGQRGLMVDGSKWRQGTPSANLADQARRLYGDRYAEFLDGVKAFAFFPLAVYKGDCVGENLTLSVKFYPQAGRIDQGAGIAWSVAPDGSYWGARANALEDNLLFFKVVRGKRSVLEVVRGVHTATRTWHTLSVALHGRSVSVVIDGQEKLKRALEAPHSGRCGLWSKADSQVLFDDFTIESK